MTEQDRDWDIEFWRKAAFTSNMLQVQDATDHLAMFARAARNEIADLKASSAGGHQ